MRAERPSLTASLVAAVRALYTALPEPYNIASDPYAAALLPAILAVPVQGAALAPGAAPYVHRAISTLSFGLSDHVALRSRAIDDALHESLARGATQLVRLARPGDALSWKRRWRAGARDDDLVRHVRRARWSRLPLHLRRERL
jgi:O-methyltransferase involved in polyketide biosynthesis